jgi:hypothetical protein
MGMLRAAGCAVARDGLGALILTRHARAPIVMREGPIDAPHLAVPHVRRGRGAALVDGIGLPAPGDRVEEAVPTEPATHVVQAWRAS